LVAPLRTCTRLKGKRFRPGVPCLGSTGYI